MGLLLPIRQHLPAPGKPSSRPGRAPQRHSESPLPRHDPEGNQQRTGMGGSLPPPAAPRVPLRSCCPRAHAANLPRPRPNPDQPHPPGKTPLHVSVAQRSRRGGIPRGPSPRRPGSGCSAGAPAASRRTAGRAAGRWAASGTGCRSPALQGMAGRAMHRAECVLPSRAHHAGTRQPVRPVPGALPGSPRLFRSSSHWLMCGNRRISLHFLLLPFRLPPPPAAGGEGEEGVRLSGQASFPCPGGVTGGAGRQSPCPVPQSRPVRGSPPSHHCWSPKPIAHTRPHQGFGQL